MKKCVDNCTSYDYRVYLATQGIEEPSEYYDANRILKIRDKLPQPALVDPILNAVLEKFNYVCRKNTIPAEMIKSHNLMLIESARNPNCKREDVKMII